MKRHLPAVVAPVLLMAALSLAGCATPPAPRSATDTLLIAPITFDRASMGNTNYPASSAAFIVTIDGLSTPVVRAQLRLDPNADYVFLRGLPPGAYEIRDIYFVDNYGKASSRYFVGAPFNLEAHGLTIFPRTFEYKFRVEGNNIYVAVYAVVITRSEARHLISILANQGVLSHWTLDRNTASLPVFARALREERSGAPAKTSVEFK